MTNEVSDSQTIETNNLSTTLHDLITQNCTANLISKKEVLTGVFKYVSSYSMSQEILPKIQNIIIYSNASVSIDFHFKGNLEPIYQAMNAVAKSLEVNASYVESNRNLPIANINSVGNKVIRIDSNVLENIYYLEHLYHFVSCPVSTLLFEVMLDLYKHKNKEQANEIREKLTLDLLAWSDYDIDDEQVLLSYGSSNDVMIHNPEQVEQLKAAQLRKAIRATSAEEQQNFLDITTNFQLIRSMQNESQYWNPKLVQERSYDKRHQEVAQMLDDPDQCLDYLNSTYPHLYPAVVKVMSKMNSTITNFESVRGQELYYKTISWTNAALNYTNNFIGTKVLSYSSGAVAILTAIYVWRNPEMKEAMKGVKEIAGATKLGIMTMDLSSIIVNDYLLPTKKVVINNEQLIKHFTCKFTLSNGNKKLGDLNDQSLEIIGDVFAKHVYYTTIQDFQEYQDQSGYTNYILEQLSNNSHITKIGLDKEFNKTIFNTSINEYSKVQDLIGHYNESACFDNIVL